jgi:hypothetical protein
MSLHPTANPWHRAASLLFVLWSAIVVVLFTQTPGGPQRAETENRDLAGLPDCTVETVLSGACMGGFDAWVSDHFPFRSLFLGWSSTIEGNRGISLASDITVIKVTEADLARLERADEWAEGTGSDLAEGSGLEPGEELAAAGSGDEALLGSGEDEAAVTGGGEPRASLKAPTSAELTELEKAMEGVELPAEKAAPASGKGAVSRVAGLLVQGDRVMQVFGGSRRAAAAFASIVNGYAAALPGVRVWSVLAPTAISFHAPKGYDSSGERVNIAQINAALSPGIRRVDVVSEMLQHASEYLYFRTDHHWTGRGAYYAYAAFCRSAGLAAVPLDSMPRKVNRGYLGSLWALTRVPAVGSHPDEVEVFSPVTKVSARVYGSPISGAGRPAAWVLPNARSYGAYLGGDFPAMVATTSVKNGRKALVIKNSFGNAFATFLANNFEEVVVIDYRYFNASVADVVVERGITDVIIAAGAFAANTSYHRNRIRKILFYNGPPPRMDSAQTEGSGSQAAEGSGQAPPAVAAPAVAPVVPSPEVPAPAEPAVPRAEAPAAVAPAAAPAPEGSAGEAP